MTPRIVLLALALTLLPAAPAVAEREADVADAISRIDEAFAFGGKRAAAAIVPFLDNPDLAVRNRAVSRLIDVGEPAVDLLVAALGNERTRWPASGALINIGAPAVRRVVLAVKDPNPVVRREALFVLQQLEVAAAAPSIQEALSDPDSTVRVQAVRALAHFRGEGALRRILAMAEDRHPLVRDAAIEALGRFGAEAVPALRSLYRRESEETRAAAVRALGGIGSEEALGLARSSLRDRSAAVRHSACRALGQSGDAASASDLVPLLSDPVPAVREAAEDACARMPAAIEGDLFSLLKRGSVAQKIGAANVARKAAYRPAVPLLIDATRDQAHEVCLSAAAALMVIGDPASIEALVNGLADDKIRWVCLIGLRHQGKAAVPSLLRRTGDPELDYWKQHALESMGKDALEGCVDELREGKDATVRNVALCTLQQIRDARAAYPVVRMMGDPQVGPLAAFLAPRMGEAAVEPLLISLRDPDPLVRARAAAALAEMRERRAEPSLRELLEDADPAVRRAAEKALETISSPRPAS